MMPTHFPLIHEKQADILVVDDTMANIQVLSAMLKQHGYKVRPVLDGPTALNAVKNQAPDLILLDINMPGMNGYEVCEALKNNPATQEIPVIFISALSEPDDKVKAFNIGGLDYITKPFQLEEVKARVETHLHLRRLQNELELSNQHLEERVREQVEELFDSQKKIIDFQKKILDSQDEILESQKGTIVALARLAEYRDEDTGFHLDRILKFCELLVKNLVDLEFYKTQIKDNFIRDIIQASPLHDIGKVGIPDIILLKPGRHTPEEFEIMKQHTWLGSDLLEKVRDSYPNNSFINMGIKIARSHHERWDGSGYPDRLKGRDIPISAHILSLADVYDALRSRRPYKEPFTHEKACEIIIAGSGTQFDPALVDKFQEIHPQFNELYVSLTFGAASDQS